MITIGKKFITPSKQISTKTQEKTIYDLRQSYQKGPLFKLTVDESCDLVDLSLADTRLRRQYGFVVFAIIKQRKLGSKIVSADSETQLSAGDILYFVKETTDDNEGLRRYNIAQIEENDPEREKVLQVIGAAEVMVAPESTLIEKSIKSFKFRDKFHLSVVSVNSNKQEHHHQPLDLKLAAGDRLLVAGSWRNINKLKEKNQDLIMLTLPQEYKSAVPKAEKAPIAVAILLFMLTTLAFKWLPTEITVLVTALLFGATGCINMEQAYKSISWKSLVLIAGMLPMATAMQKTGAMTLIVQQLVEQLGDAGPLMIMATLFIITTVFSQFISNTATAVLIAPIATGLSETMSVSAYPLVMIVAIAASTAFSTPVASPVNALILGPGGYKFGEFAKVGVPLQVIILIISLLILPILFPF
jgi:di/tricarboxylate transporter